MRSTTPTEKARIAAGAVTAVVMTAVLLVFVLACLLAL
ncbi:type IV secretory pathway component VirB8 [Bradyrhizobium sp. CIR3A]|nr:type IV secretory pathway component VirB8 [Bradyrhizobium sp. CIR3A]MBB4394042.1 type IV secretory pathway component VirB8 [Bradyrhizobium sp. ERR14]NYG46097.1 type IV secretory pathway component VirB8 [Bradyrhizobium sp. IAR9]